jgi:hypothetical protein
MHGRKASVLQLESLDRLLELLPVVVEEDL